MVSNMKWSLTPASSIMPMPAAQLPPHCLAEPCWHHWSDIRLSVDPLAEALRHLAPIFRPAPQTSAERKTQLGAQDRGGARYPPILRCKPDPYPIASTPALGPRFRANPYHMVTPAWQALPTNSRRTASAAPPGNRQTCRSGHRTRIASDPRMKARRSAHPLHASAPAGHASTAAP